MPVRTIEELNQWRSGLPRLLGFEVVHAEAGLLRAQMQIRPELLAANGYLHAASIVGLADTACGFGTVCDLPDDAKGFTTIELKSNFLCTALEGTIFCEARRQHRGRTTQVWDAEVRLDRVLALFRCTELILY